MEGRLLAPDQTHAATASPLHSNPALTAALPSTSGTITFHSNRAGNHDIYAQDVAAAEPQILTGGAHSEVTPMWSPDGTQLLFSSDRDGDFEIYLRQAGGEEIQLTDNNSADIHPEWAPAGDTILFASDRGGGTFQIYRLPLSGAAPAGAAEQVAVDEGNHALHPRYSPDGSQIAFMRASRLSVSCLWNWDIWLVDAGGGNLRQLTSHLYADVYPDWTPDGRAVTHASCRDLFSPDFDLYSTPAAGGESARWHDWSGSHEWNAVFAPDGSALAFNSNFAGDNDILITPAADGVPDDVDTKTAIFSTGTAAGSADDNVGSWRQRPSGESFTISGVIETADGEPLAGVTVLLDGAPAAESGADGGYAFEALPAGVYTVAARREGYSFSPTARTVFGPPDAGESDFTATDCRTIETDKPPLLLVTGWSGSAPGGVADDDQLSHLLEPLRRRNYLPGCNLFYAPDTSAYKTQAENAQDIARALCEMAVIVAAVNPQWDGRVEIIGYSYGGLRGRAFLEAEALYDRRGWRDCENGQRVRVGNLFTLGTPHGGSWGEMPFGAYIGFCALVNAYAGSLCAPTVGGTGTQQAALYEMLPPVRALQNLLSRQPEGVCYRTIVGDGRRQAGQFPPTLASIYAAWLPAQAVPNDLAVTQSSSFALSRFGPRYPRSTFITTGDLHGQVPAHFDPLTLLRSYVNPGDTFEAEIYPYLGSDTCATVDTTHPTLHSVERMFAPLPFRPDQLQPVQAAAQAARTLDIAADVMPASGSASGTFELHSRGPTFVGGYWMDGALEMVLEDPQGQTVDPVRAAADPEVDYVEIDTGFGRMAGYQLARTPPGTWRYTLRAPDPQAVGGYRLLAVPAEPIAVSGAAPGWSAFGAAVPLTATVTVSETQLLPGMAVTATVRRPDGALSALPLYDDGAHGDGQAEDGVYGARYADTALSGTYGVRFTARGEYESSPFTRTSAGFFSVGSDRARLSGGYADSGEDADGDERFEWLRVTVGISVTEGSDYTLAGELYAGDRFLDSARAALPLPPG
ncbi:MAG: choice-of-anchor X domain-containing protein, partial [Candidatus Promineifilaceae bacterium]|nr:choice-of-anchor X domain-containing protein [Candidatus Promineifilaceae bacterium]